MASDQWHIAERKTRRVAENLAYMFTHALF